MYEDDGPIYLQLARHIADDILAGTYAEGSAVPSASEYAVFYQMNAATAGKGVNLLVEQGVLFKKRGIGMFVAEGAKARLREQRRAEFLARHIAPLVHEARALDIPLAEVVDLIQQEERHEHTAHA